MPICKCANGGVLRCEMPLLIRIIGTFAHLLIGTLSNCHIELLFSFIGEEVVPRRLACRKIETPEYIAVAAAEFLVIRAHYQKLLSRTDIIRPFLQMRIEDPAVAPSCDTRFTWILPSLPITSFESTSHEPFICNGLPVSSPIRKPPSRK